MNFTNKIRAGVSVCIGLAVTLITSNPAHAQFVSALDSWPTNWPISTSIEQEEFSEKQIKLYLPKGRFGLSILNEKSKTTENK